MIVIKNIRIRYFRSLRELSVNNVNHLNVFSGKNDSGKSNILKALDIFFNDKPINFNEDYNKARLEEVRKTIKGKQFIDIKITFNTPKGYTTLPENFTITKSWDRNGDLIGPPVDNLENLVRKGKFKPKNLKIAKRSLSLLLKGIRYKYIPGVRDERFFSQLLRELQTALFKKEDRKRKTEYSVRTAIKEFNKYISGITSELNNDFKKTSGIETNLSFPTELTLLFERLLVGTRSENYDIPLYLRGDGIRLWYIPTILNYISNISSNYFIWGFDEPENSCEYSLTNKLANDFVKKYIKNSQIFVSTHSFSFITIENKNCSRYRIIKYGLGDTKAIEFSKIVKQKNELLSELGIIEINSKLKKVYEELENELDGIEKIKEELNNKQKPFVIFEGESDNIHFSLAYKKLYNRDISRDWNISEHIKNDKGTSFGDGAPLLNQFLYNHIGKIDTENLIITIFDFDEEGVNQIKSLKDLFINVSSEYDNNIVYQHKKKNNVFAILLVPPVFRQNYIDFNDPVYSYLSSELLYKDDFIPIQNRRYPSKNDTSVFKFKGKKISFARSIKESFENVDFDGFKNTFELLEKIKQLNNYKSG